MVGNATVVIDLDECCLCGLRYHGCPRCPGCGGADSETVTAEGVGTLYTWTTTWRAFDRDGPDLPYTVGIVELTEGPRVHGLINVQPEFLRAGMGVRLASSRIEDAGIAFEFVPVSIDQGA